MPQIRHVIIHNISDDYKKSRKRKLTKEFIKKRCRATVKDKKLDTENSMKIIDRAQEYTDSLQFFFKISNKTKLSNLNKKKNKMQLLRNTLSKSQY